MKESTVLRGINELSKEEQITKVKEHPYMIKYLDVQVEDVVLAALQVNPKVLCLVRKQTFEECRLAVTKDYTNIAYVKDLTEELAEAAVKVDPDAKYYLPEELFQKFSEDRAEGAE